MDPRGRGLDPDGTEQARLDRRERDIELRTRALYRRRRRTRTWITAGLVAIVVVLAIIFAGTWFALWAAAVLFLAVATYASISMRQLRGPCEVCGRKDGFPVSEPRAPRHWWNMRRPPRPDTRFFCTRHFSTEVLWPDLHAAGGSKGP